MAHTTGGASCPHGLESSDDAPQHASSRSPLSLVLTGSARVDANPASDALRVRASNELYNLTMKRH